MNLEYVILNAHITTTTLMFLIGMNTEISDYMQTFDIFKCFPLRIILVQPPKRIVHVYKRFEVPAWYDITVDDHYVSEDQKSINEGKSAILNLIDQLKIDYENLILAGYSQGGALAIYTACNVKKKFKAVIGICTYLCYDLLKKTHNKQNILLLNTYDDDIIPLNLVYCTLYFFRQFKNECYHFVCPGTHNLDCEKLFLLVNLALNGQIFRQKLRNSIELFCCN